MEKKDNKHPNAKSNRKTKYDTISY